MIGIKFSLMQRLHDWAGDRFIGPIEELSKRSGVNLFGSFYLPRRSIHLTSIEPGQMVKRIEDNDYRRRLTKWIAIYMTPISLANVLFWVFVFPPVVSGLISGVSSLERSTTNKVKIGLARGFGSTASCSGEEYSTGCLQYLKDKIGLNSKRLEEAAAGLDEGTFKNLIALRVMLTAKTQSPVGSNEAVQIEAQISQLEKTLQISPTQLSKIKDILNEDIADGIRRTKVEAYFEGVNLLTKAKTTPLTEQEKSRYKQIKELTGK
ncbi:hypothetical protein [Variovorax sp. W2I14]|uniref:hypothetical protein n=1 Tax=Variovorax sp. W2I14 TaxID=3042290 RepID=UPI003D22AA6A